MQNTMLTIPVNHDHVITQNIYKIYLFLTALVISELLRPQMAELPVNICELYKIYTITGHAMLSLCKIFTITVHTM